jgi:hypothetical protein
MYKLATAVIFLPLLTMTAGARTAVAADGKATAAAQTHSPESLECSKQADAKGLHGKARKEFRSTCKKELKKKS